MNRISTILIPSLLLVPMIVLAGGGTEIASSNAVAISGGRTYRAGSISDTVRPSWLPDERIFPTMPARFGTDKPTFNAIDRTQLSGECSDPSVSDIAFVMLQRLGVCPASRLSTRY